MPDLPLDLPDRNAPPDDDEIVPLVLVVGATGRTGRIIVRKLVLQGYRVAVLVRSLSSATLNLLGSGVTYAYGDMQDYRSLLDSMEDVDKIVFVASSSDPDAELEGLRNVLRAFQDTRTFTYGEAEATKLNLFKFRRETDFARWSVEREKGSPVGVPLNMLEGSDKQVVANANTAIAYWKRSVTGSHSNAVFVGRVFDTFLGSAVASCDFRPKAPPPRALAAGEDPAAGDGPQEESASLATFAAAERMLVPQGDAESGDAELNFGEYSGLVLKAIGDGQRYTAIVRTALYEELGIEYHADFVTRNGSFVVARLPFSTFRPHVNGVPVTAVRGQTVGELDRKSVVGFGVAFFPQRNDPDRCDGSFYLSLRYIKSYRRRDEPEIVYVSDASVTGNADAADSLPGSGPRPKYVKRRGKQEEEGQQAPVQELRSAAPDDDDDDDGMAGETFSGRDGVSDLGEAASAAAAVATELRTASADGETPTDEAQEVARAAARAAAAAQTVAAEAVQAEVMAAAAEEAAEEEARLGLASAEVEAVGVAAEAVDEEEKSVAVEADSSVGALVKAKGEAVVRSSGLTYFIVRPVKLTDDPGGFARIEFSQDRIDSRRTVSRADLAEVVVRSLLDPRACNLACSVSASEYARLRGQEAKQDISKMLEVMQPNRT